MPVSAGFCGRRNRVETGRPRNFARLGGEAAADDQGDAAAGAHFVEQDFGLVRRRCCNGLPFFSTLPSIGVDVDDVAHVHLRDVAFDRQGAGVFHGVEEDRRDLAAEAEAAEALVRHEGNVVAGPPEHRVGGGLARGAGADHVADVGDRVALLLQFVEQLDRAALARLRRARCRRAGSSAWPARAAECRDGSRRRAPARGRRCWFRR